MLSPSLFLMYINDLSNNINSTVILLAYDCVMYAPIGTPTHRNLKIKSRESKEDQPVCMQKLQANQQCNFNAEVSPMRYLRKQEEGGQTLHV